MPGKRRGYQFDLLISWLIERGECYD